MGQDISANVLSYTREQAVQASLVYFKGDELAANVWVNKYALKNSSGEYFELTPDDMHKRLASELARIEAKYPNPMSEAEIFDLIRDFKYAVPQGGPMTGIGNNLQFLSLSNCFVVGNPEGSGDSYGAIMRIDERIAQLQKRRCGVGTGLDEIRPAGVRVNNAAITSTGIVPFAERYSNTTREVAQGGRRGALMITCSIRHPESEQFIDAKMDTTKVTGANISVKIHDDFMEAMLSKAMYPQQWPIYSENPVVKKEVDAEALWKKIIHNAWKSAEPGVLFWDKIVNESPADCYADRGFRTISTNPCGELPLCSGDSCRLLAINLYSYVIEPFTENAKFNWVLFREHARKAQRLMDDIVDLEIEKIQAILEKIKRDPEEPSVKRNEIEMWEEILMKCMQGRRTGTGITAEGDMLAALSMKYGTTEATAFAEEVQKTLAIEAYKSSCIMAAERGAFPIYDEEVETDNPFLNRIKEADNELRVMMDMYGRRNIALLTIAPAGTVSIMTQTTSGGESVFLVSHTRRRKVNPNDENVKVVFVDELGDSWEEYSVFHHKFKVWLETNGYEIAEVEKMSPEELRKIVALSPYGGAEANDIDWVEKVKMQGAMQKWIDHSISVTVNLPKEVTEELVNDVYVAAWKAGCKGCTIYRDGSRDGVLISNDKKAEKREEIAKEVKAEMFAETHAPRRPKMIECDIHRFSNKGERWIALVGLLEDKPYEIWTGPVAFLPVPSNIESGTILKNKSNGESRYDLVYEVDGNFQKIEGLNVAFDKETHDMSKTFSALLRHGMPLPYVVQLIEGLQLDGDLISTWKNGFKRTLKKYIADGTAVKSRAANCPRAEGGCNLIYQEGCLMCTVCGNSKCS